MQATTIKRGALAGMVGGAMMAMVAMLAMWLDGSAATGFWTPVNLIAHTLWRGAPLDYEFSLGALVLGMAVHMMMAMTLGAAVAAIVSKVARLGRSLGFRLLIGVGIALLVWVVMQYLAWPLVDRAAAEVFTTWIFAVSHIIFGMVTAVVLHVTMVRGQSGVAQISERTGT
jgi:hypothetical protein